MANNIEYVKERELKYMLENSGIPKPKQTPVSLTPSKVDIDAFKKLQRIQKDIPNFVANGKNLYIHSEIFGNGKTSWGIKILLEYFEHVWFGNRFRVRGMFINVGWFLNKLKETISRPDKDFEEFCSYIETCDLVVWDDISTSGMSDYDHSKLLSYIDNRVFNEKSNIFTGNLKDDDLWQAIGGRLHSRVWNGSIKVELRGKDMRGVDIYD